MRTPVDNPRITQTYGRTPFAIKSGAYKYSGGIHTGWDYGANCGTPVKAITNGTIIKQGTDSGFGNYVLVSHNNQFLALYAHLQGFAKSTWSHLNEGETLGFLGTSGYSTGCHLHFETKNIGSGLYNGWFNPATIFKQGGTMEWWQKDINAKAVQISNLKKSILTEQAIIKKVKENILIEQNIIKELREEMKRYIESSKRDAKTIADLHKQVLECTGKEATLPEDESKIINFFKWLKTWFKK